MHHRQSFPYYSGALTFSCYEEAHYYAPPINPLDIVINLSLLTASYTFLKITIIYILILLLFQICLSLLHGLHLLIVFQTVNVLYNQFLQELNESQILRFKYGLTSIIKFIITVLNTFATQNWHDVT